MIVDATVLLREEIRLLRERLEVVEAALLRIAMHPHQQYDYNTAGHIHQRDRQYEIGVVGGHRCAAEIARGVLAP